MVTVAAARRVGVLTAQNAVPFSRCWGRQAALGPTTNRTGVGKSDY